MVRSIIHVYVDNATNYIIIQNLVFVESIFMKIGEIFYYISRFLKNGVSICNIGISNTLLLDKDKGALHKWIIT
jgi:hypothetical protein